MNEFLLRGDSLTGREEQRRAAARRRALRRQDLTNLCTGAAVLGTLYLIVVTLLP